jgi:phenylacetic acid degradation operon negative regulatory protein
VTDRVLRPRSGSSAKAVLLTVLGEFVLPTGGAAWTQTLVEALAALDIEEKNARQALSRLADQGFIARRRVGRRVRWQLTADGTELLGSGTERIYGFGEAHEPWDGRWLVVLFSVPPDQRGKRHQLRSRLSFAGFGFLGTGVAITPHVEREARAASVLKDLGVANGAVVLRAELGDLASVLDVLHRAWDLDGLAQLYRRFISRFERSSPSTAQERFRATAHLVHEWRRFPFVDPELPDDLLWERWPGRAAKALFDDCHRRWSGDALAFFESLEETDR